MYYFVGYDGLYYQGIVMRMLAAFHEESEKVMVVSSRGSLDAACIYSASPDMMLRR